MRQATLIADSRNVEALTLTAFLDGQPQEVSNLNPGGEIVLDVSDPRIAYALSDDGFNSGSVVEEPSFRPLITAQSLYSAYKSTVDTTAPTTPPLVEWDALLPDRQAAWTAVAKLANGVD